MIFRKTLIAVICAVVPQLGLAGALAEYETKVTIAAENVSKTDIYLQLFQLVDPPYEELFGASEGHVKINKLVTPNGEAMLLSEPVILASGYFAGRSEAQPDGLANIGTRAFLRIEVQNLRAVEARVALKMTAEGTLAGLVNKGGEKDKAVSFSTVELKEVTPFGDETQLKNTARVEADQRNKRTETEIDFDNAHIVTLAPEATKVFWVDMISFAISAAGDVSVFGGVEP